MKNLEFKKVSAKAKKLKKLDTNFVFVYQANPFVVIVGW